MRALHQFITKLVVGPSELGPSVSTPLYTCKAPKAFGPPWGAIRATGCDRCPTDLVCHAGVAS